MKYIVVKSAYGIVPNVSSCDTKDEAIAYAYTCASIKAFDTENYDEPEGEVVVEDESECKQYDEKYIYRASVMREGLKYITWYVYEV